MAYIVPHAEKPGSEAPHYHLNQEEHIKVKQGKLGYFIGHQTHVKAAEMGEELTIKPGKCMQNLCCRYRLLHIE